MIKNIIFDLGGVLLDISMENAMRELGKIGFDMKAVMEKQKAMGGDGGSTMCEGVSAVGFLDDYSKGLIPTDEFMKMLQANCRPGTTVEQAENAWNACLFTIPQHKMDMIRELHKEYNIYMLSNTNDAHWKWIVENSFPDDIDPYSDFDKIFLSQEMHMAKPNTDIFEQVLKEIGAQAEECLFIDDASKNTEVAAKMGYKTYTADISRMNADGTFTKPEVEWCDVIGELMVNG